MVKFIKKVIALLLILAVLWAGIAGFSYFVIGSQYLYNYQASLVDKVERLKSLNEPKIILVGNSNLAFGMDSERIEKALGMPVVNLGLHGGLGNAFHEEIAKLNLRKGDIVVVCHSHFNDGDGIDDRRLAWITIDNHPELLNILRWKDIPGMLAAYPDYLKHSIQLWMNQEGNQDTGGCYSRNAFNRYGDVVVKPEEGRVDPEILFAEPEPGRPVDTINDICISRLNQYCRYVRKQGAEIVVAGFPIAYGENETFGKKDFELYRSVLEEKLDCPIISDYSNYFFPYEMFYDTRYHLTKEGAEKRADQLAADLKAWMAGK